MSIEADTFDGGGDPFPRFHFTYKAQVINPLANIYHMMIKQGVRVH
jgi:hypothetical protein